MLVNGALFLRAYFLSYASLFGFLIAIFPLTKIYASLKSHRPDLNIDVLNLICLLVLYALRKKCSNTELFLVRIFLYSD